MNPAPGCGGQTTPGSSIWQEELGASLEITQGYSILETSSLRRPGMGGAP